MGGGSARGQISRGTWEARQGGEGSFTNAARESITWRAALAKARLAWTGVTIEQIEASEAGVQGFLDDIEESLRTKSYKPEAVRRC